MRVVTMLERMDWRHRNEQRQFTKKMISCDARRITTTRPPEA